MNRRRAAMIGMALGCAGVTGCPSGWKLQAVDGAEPSITAATWLNIECTKESLKGASDIWLQRLRPHVHCAGATTFDEQRLCTTAPSDRDTRTVRHPKQLVSLLSFVHLSDAQLKEHQIHMEGPLGNAQTYDGIKSTSARDLLLEQNDDAALLATILAVNRMPGLFALQKQQQMTYAGYDPPAPPSFVIHTGDAVDAGMFSELLQFIAVMDQLDIPYYNAIGNHDNLFFGTLPGNRMSGFNVVSPYVPIVTTERFMRYHSWAGHEQDVTLPFPTQRSADHDPTKNPEGLRVAQASAFHGFDLICRNGELDESAVRLENPPRKEPVEGAPVAPTQEARDVQTKHLCNEARGYYTLDLKLHHEVGGTRLLRAIVLNTAQVLPESVVAGVGRMSEGNMLPEQMRWLKAQLNVGGANPPFFLVLGHHNLDSFLDDDQAEELRALLLEHPRVLGYVGAHTHVDDIKEWPRASGPSLWEIVGGSTLVYPQLGRLIELLEDPESQRIVMRVLSFRQVFGDAASELRRAGAQTCRPPEKGECRPLMPSDDSFCQRLADRAAFARAGADRDEDEDRRDESEAVARANGVMPVFQLGGSRP